jgi:nucleoside-diphosphate-sugar epimerase
MDLASASVKDLVVLIQASRPDALINCAGRTSGTAEELWEINTSFVEKLVQALRLSGPAPLVHIGSAAEYGIQPENVSINEAALTHPVSDYGRSKLAATRKVVYAAEQGDISATVLRVFNPIGAGMPEDSLVGRASKELRLALENNRRFITMGPLTASRDFVAASDVASAALRVAKITPTDPVINVGRGIAMSCRALVELLANVAGYDGGIVEVGEGSTRSDEVPWQQADIARLVHNLDWLPRTPLAQALEEVWNSAS